MPPKKRLDIGEMSGVKATAETVITAQKLKQAKAENRYNRGPRTTYDLPRRVTDGIREVAETEGISASDVAALALATFLQGYHAGGVEIQKRKAPSVRFFYKVLLPEGWRD